MTYTVYYLDLTDDETALANECFGTCATLTIYENGCVVGAGGGGGSNLVRDGRGDGNQSAPVYGTLRHHRVVYRGPVSKLPDLKPEDVVVLSSGNHARYGIDMVSIIEICERRGAFVMTTHNSKIQRVRCVFTDKVKDHPNYRHLELGPPEAPRDLSVRVGTSGEPALYHGNGTLAVVTRSPRDRISKHINIICYPSMTLRDFVKTARQVAVFYNISVCVAWRGIPVRITPTDTDAEIVDQIISEVSGPIKSGADVAAMNAWMNPDQ